MTDKVTNIESARQQKRLEAELQLGVLDREIAELKIKLAGLQKKRRDEEIRLLGREEAARRQLMHRGKDLKW